jgi:hypothetical protein
MEVDHRGNDQPYDNAASHDYGHDTEAIDEEEGE